MQHPLVVAAVQQYLEFHALPTSEVFINVNVSWWLSSVIPVVALELFFPSSPLQPFVALETCFEGFHYPLEQFFLKAAWLFGSGISSYHCSVMGSANM